MSNEKIEKILGIDLGTTNSAAAVIIGGKPTIISSAEGVTVAGKMFPSVVAFTRDGQLLVGEPAPTQRGRYAKSSEKWVRTIKSRFLGKSTRRNKSRH
jgi:molecular chaperone DnaK (HSP70)